MAVRRKQEPLLEEDLMAIPPPVKNGYAFIQSLGRFVDELMRHSRDGERSGISDLSAKERPEDDPEPIEPPPPVPGGTETR